MIFNDIDQPAKQWLRDGLTITVLLALATAGGFVLDYHVSLTSQAMLYVLAVIIAAYRMSWRGSIVCALLAVALLNFFFVPPRWTFQVESQENLVALFTLLILALVVNHLTASMRHETEVARLNAWRAHQVQQLTTELAGTSNLPDVHRTALAALQSAFSGPCYLALQQDSGALSLGVPSTPDAPAQLMDGLQCCMRENAILGPGTGRWPGLEAWYLPLAHKEQALGAACVAPAMAADGAARAHAQALCSVIAQAVRQIQLNAHMLRAEAEAQRQLMQNTFLAAISHDLRTPLATVVGATSILQTQRDKLSTAEQDRLLASVLQEANYLSNITENTLQLVRLNNVSQPIAMDWESIEEIVGAALARTRLHDPARRIASKVPEGLPLIKADPVLLTQLICNLLDNALKYSESSVDLSVQLHGDEMWVAVKDRGSAIPEALAETLFEPYARNDHSGQRGVGLGLALCRAIALAHHGKLALRRRSGGGNSFTLSLPLEQHQPEVV